MEFSERKVLSALFESWSPQTAIQWSRDNPALGQCNVTSLLIEELFGGRILKTRYREGFHFYNEIDGRRYDFTASQFTSRVDYDDIPSSRQEAGQGITGSERKALRSAFLVYYPGAGTRRATPSPELRLRR
jgi:hypothetical protein